MMEKPSYYAVIPAPVRYSGISPNAKLMFGEITCLCEAEGFCWASNGYLAKLYEAGERTVSRWLTELEKAGFIRIEPAVNQHGQRRIFIQTALPKVAGQKWQAKNGDHNNTREENTTSIGIAPVSPKPTKASRREPARTSLTEYLAASGGVPPVEWAEWAVGQFGWDFERLNFEWDDFNDYWTSGNAVGGGRKADWPATWRGHCRRVAKDSRRSGSAGGQSGRGFAAAFGTSVARRYGISPAGGGLGGRASPGGAGADAGDDCGRLPVGEIPF